MRVEAGRWRNADLCDLDVLVGQPVRTVRAGTTQLVGTVRRERFDHRRVDPHASCARNLELEAAAQTRAHAAGLLARFQHAVRRNAQTTTEEVELQVAGVESAVFEQRSGPPHDGLQSCASLTHALSDTPR